MQMQRLLTAAAVLACAVLASTVDTPAAAPKPANPQANFTFRNDPGDAIRSDEIGASYISGVDGVVGQIYANGSGEATLNLYRSRPKRVFVGDYDAGTQPPGTPDGSFADGWFINIHSVWNIESGETVERRASFTTGVGEFRWCGAGDDEGPAWCNGFTGSQTVTVTRNGNTWHVVADSPVNMPNMLLQSYKGGLRVAGYYDMPFALTIEQQ
jgi:hypothetical protein